MATAENTDTKKKKKKRGCFWRIVFWLALVVFIGSVGTLGYLFYTYWQGQNEYEEIASRAVEGPEDGQVTNLADLVVDWDALRAINPDIVAWVYMPGTIINYPVAHKDGDSEYYLHHNFSLGEGSFGTCDGADNTWRYITFADVAEFVPISYVGSDTYQGDTAVEDGAADEIAADAQERAEN